MLGFYYKNPVDCIKKMFKEEGPTSFYRGFAAYFIVHSFMTIFMLQNEQR